VQETAAFGSRAVGLIFYIQNGFSQFFGADSGQLGDALDEPGKPRRRQSCPLRKGTCFSETHGKDWEDSVRKGGTPDSRCWQFSSTLACFRRFSRFRLT
jgi:hypothetical protein